MRHQFCVPSLVRGPEINCCPELRLFCKTLRGLGAIRTSLPCPLTKSDVWITSIRDNEWLKVVARIFFTSSCGDPCRDKFEECDCPVLLPLVCSYCGAAFPSRHQLSGHKQHAHNWRKPIGKFVDDSGICCACGLRFADRLRVLNHVATRSCGTTISNERFEPVPAKLLCQVVSRDRKLRLQARHEGRSEPFAGELLKDTC